MICNRFVDLFQNLFRAYMLDTLYHEFPKQCFYLYIQRYDYMQILNKNIVRFVSLEVFVKWSHGTLILWLPCRILLVFISMA